MSVMPDFCLYRPASVEEAAALLAENPDARLLAAGTDLLPNLRRGIGEPAGLVDLGAIADLDQIATQRESLVLGAMTRLETLSESSLVKSGWAMLAEAAATVAGPTHRAAATVGGNLCQDTRCVFYNQSEWWREANGWCLKYKGDSCHVVKKSDRCYAAYAGDLAPALMVLQATAIIAGPNGQREVALEELYREEGRHYLALQPGEFLARIIVPPMALATRAGYAKVRVRDAVDFPLAGVAVALRREGGVLAELRVALTGIASAPRWVAGLEELMGRPWNAEVADSLAEAVRKSCNTVKTTLTSPKYRRHMASANAVHLTEQLWKAH